MLCAFMHEWIYIYGKQRTLELESMLIGVRELPFISGWNHVSVDPTKTCTQANDTDAKGLLSNPRQRYH